MGASLSLNSSLSPFGKSVLEVRHEMFRTTLLSLIQKSCTRFKNLRWLREQGCTLTTRLPKLHGGRCPWPLFDKGSWQWFSKLLRLGSLGTKSYQESELYLPVQQLVWKLCYKIRKKWSNSKSKWIIGAMAARCWRARENWEPAWQMILNHSFCEWKKALGVCFLRFHLPSHRISLIEDYFLLCQPKMNSWLSREVLLC